jgi:hypothetical protein
VTSPDKYQAYIGDLGYLVKEAAMRARENYEASREDDRQVNLGRLLAYHFVVGLMQQQAEAFGIPLEEIRLQDINPDRDLT